MQNTVLVGGVRVVVKRSICNLKLKFATKNAPHCRRLERKTPRLCLPLRIRKPTIENTKHYNVKIPVVLEELKNSNFTLFESLPFSLAFSKVNASRAARMHQIYTERAQQFLFSVHAANRSRGVINQ